MRARRNGARGRIRVGGALGRIGGGTLRRIKDGFEIEGERVIQRCVELVDYLAHGVRTLAAILFQHARDQRAQKRRYLPRGHELRNRLFLSAPKIEMRIVRRITREKLVSERPQPIDIVRLGRGLTAQLLGAGSEWRKTLQARGRRGCRCSARGTKIGQLHPAACIEQHVSGLQVAMDDPALMRVLQRLCDVQEHRNDVQIARATQPAQIAAGGELHGQHDRLAQMVWRKNLQHRSMIQTTRNRVLALKGSEHRFARSSSSVGHLQSDVDPAGVVVGTPHLALTARAQFLEQGETRVQTVTF